MEDLLNKCIKGDKEAFVKVINTMERKLYIIARSKINNEDDVKDIIQDTILSCYCNLFYKNTKNIVKISYEEKYFDNFPTEDGYLKVNNNIDFFNLLNLIDDDDEKIIFSLFYIEDCTTNKISKLLKINENTIKSKLKRARDKIKKVLERSDKNE